MVAKSPLQQNAVRDQRYRQIFNDIQRNISYLEHPAVVPEVLWDSEIAARIDAAGKRNGYRSGRKISTAPNLFVIGYDSNSMAKTTAFLESLALDGIFDDCSFLIEGYDGRAAMISRVNQVTNQQLNGLFTKYRITPQGRDDFELREKQYRNLQEIASLQCSSNPDEHNIEEKVLEGMDCLIKRERDYFTPAIVEQKNKGKPVIFLANMVHAVSSNFPIVLNNNRVKYAFFVPWKRP